MGNTSVQIDRLNDRVKQWALSQGYEVREGEFCDLMHFPGQGWFLTIGVREDHSLPVLNESGLHPSNNIAGWIIKEAAMVILESLDSL